MYIDIDNSWNKERISVKNCLIKDNIRYRYSDYNDDFIYLVYYSNGLNLIYGQLFESDGILVTGLNLCS